MTRITDLARRVESLEDDSEDDTSASEYTSDLTEADYEFLDEMFGGGGAEWPPELTKDETFSGGERPPELAKEEKEALDAAFDVDPWESQ